MKKTSLVISVLLLFLFTSCGSNKWSCKKRYCSVSSEKLKQLELNNAAVADAEIVSADFKKH